MLLSNLQITVFLVLSATLSNSLRSFTYKHTTSPTADSRKQCLKTRYSLNQRRLSDNEHWATVGASDRFSKGYRLCATVHLTNVIVVVTIISITMICKQLMCIQSIIICLFA